MRNLTRSNRTRGIILWVLSAYISPSAVWCNTSNCRRRNNCFLQNLLATDSCRACGFSFISTYGLPLSATFVRPDRDVAIHRGRWAHLQELSKGSASCSLTPFWSQTFKIYVTRLTHKISGFLQKFRMFL